MKRLGKLGDHWKTVKEISEKLRFTVTAPHAPEDACRHWLRRHGVASVRRGRIILVDEHDVARVTRDSSGPTRKTEAA